MANDFGNLLGRMASVTGGRGDKMASWLQQNKQQPQNPYTYFMQQQNVPALQGVGRHAMLQDSRLPQPTSGLGLYDVLQRGPRNEPGALRQALARRRYMAIRGNWPNLGSRKKWTPQRLEAERALLAQYPEARPLESHERAQWKLQAIDEYQQRLNAGEDPGDLRQFLEDKYNEFREARRLEFAQGQGV